MYIWDHVNHVHIYLIFQGSKTYIYYISSSSSQAFLRQFGVGLIFIFLIFYSTPSTSLHFGQFVSNFASPLFWYRPFNNKYIYLISRHSIFTLSNKPFKKKVTSYCVLYTTNHFYLRNRKGFTIKFAIQF